MAESVCYALETRARGSEDWIVRKITSDWSEAQRWTNQLEAFARQKNTAEACVTRREKVLCETVQKIARESNPDLE